MKPVKGTKEFERLVEARGALATAVALLRLTPTTDRDKSVSRAQTVDRAVSALESAAVANALKNLERGQ